MLCASVSVYASLRRQVIRIQVIRMQAVRMQATGTLLNAYARSDKP